MTTRSAAELQRGSDRAGGRGWLLVTRTFGWLLHHVSHCSNSDKVCARDAGTSHSTQEGEHTLDALHPSGCCSWLPAAQPSQTSQGAPCFAHQPAAAKQRVGRFMDRKRDAQVEWERHSRPGDGSRSMESGGGGIRAMQNRGADAQYAGRGRSKKGTRSGWAGENERRSATGRRGLR
jgi:hypothetical protein